MEGDRQMFDVNVSCGECGTAITQLPFEPSGDRPVYCSACLKARRENRRERKMFDVDLNCGECGTHISQLPFQPTGDRPVYCFDCNKSRRA
jgi:CxxC-x17-CxxC domain-containing protein